MANLSDVDVGDPMMSWLLFTKRNKSVRMILFEEANRNITEAGSKYVNYQKEILYTVSIIIIGSGVRHISSVMHIPVPYTVTVFLLGIVFGFLPVGAIADVGPYTIMVVFLPVLIFEGAFAVDVYVFKQIFLQVMLMAFPALVMMIGLTGLVSIFVFRVEGFNWKVAMMFASILSATDPVAVVAIMKELGVKRHLSLLIEGESLLNDGSAMVFFKLFYLWTLEKEDFNAMQTFRDLVWMSTGGPLFGYVMAKIAVFCLEWTFNDSLTEISITLISAYITFFIAEGYLMVSGVLAVVTCGIVISGSKTSITPEVEPYLHCFWETLSFIANTLIFALSGLIISKKVLHSLEFTDLMVIIILYVMLQVIRGLTIFMFSPILGSLGYGMTWQEGLVATWSGLRGAVGLTLALIVATSELDKEIKYEILFVVSVIVVLTLFINATTVSSLLTFLGVSGVSVENRISMQKAIATLDQGREKSINIWKIDRLLTNSNWNFVKSFCTMKDPYRHLEMVKEITERKVFCPNCNTSIHYSPTAEELHKTKAEAVRKFLKMIKKNLWEQFEHGTLGGYGYQTLAERIDQASDKDLQMISVRELKGLWKKSPWSKQLEKVIFNNIVSPLEEINKLASPTRKAYYRWQNHWGVMLIIHGFQFMVFLMSMLVWYFNLTAEIFMGFTNCLICVNIISIIHFLFRLFIFKTNFMQTTWFYIALFNTIASISDIYLLVFFESLVIPRTGAEKLFDSGIIFHLLRAFYFLPLLEAVNLFLRHHLNQRQKNALREFYHIAWAFVNAVEKASKNIENITDSEDIFNRLMHHSEITKTELVREMGLVQGLYPNIALGVKTTHSIRNVLNVMRDTIYDLLDEGRIEEVEGSIFVRVIETKMKRLYAAPPKLAPPSVEKILAGISWIDNNKQLINFIKANGVRNHFPSLWTIVKCGEKSNGISIILSGLVRVEAERLNLTDYLATGNVIGEISLLTNKPRIATLICETSVEVLHLNTKKFEEAMELFSSLDPPLKVRLWKMAATRLALTILSNYIMYKGWSKESLSAMLENFYLEEIKGQKFDTKNKKDVMLIVGIANSDQERYESPCLIPQSVKYLIIPANQNPLPMMFYNFED